MRRSAPRTIPAFWSRLVTPLIGGVIAAICVPAPAALLPPPADAGERQALPPPLRTNGSPDYILDPIAPNGLGIHVNMPSIRNTTFGWERFAEIIDAARAGGFYLLLNNLDGPRNGVHLAATFDNWTYDELSTFMSIIVGSRVPILLYVGAVEDQDVYFAVGPDRLASWYGEVAWIRTLTNANAGLVIDAATLGDINTAPGGDTFLGYYSQYARVLAAFGMEVGFEAFRLDNQNVPLEDRRYYALLQFIVSRFEVHPPRQDTDARIMSAIDNIPPAECPRRNTVWLDNAMWDELADGDYVPPGWLDHWGVTPDQLQAEAAARLWAKGYGLILPADSFGL